MMLDADPRWLDDPTAFEALARPFLLQDEATYCFLLSLLPRLKPGECRFLALVREGETVRGVAVLSPLHDKLFLTELSAPQASLVAAKLGERHVDFKACNGAPATARAFAEAWSAVSGKKARLGMRQGIHRLERLVPPTRPAEGRFRVANVGERELLVEWARAFMKEVNLDHNDPSPVIDRGLAEDRLYVWEREGKVVTMAGAAGPTPSGIRINLVFTPPELRGHGYATHCVAELTRLLLAQGRNFVFLYTDLDNATSNGIYARLGYELIGKVDEYTFSNP